ncbi:MAG: SDR family oxidoreductase [Candidatus Omnitrophota bacterium]
MKIDFTGRKALVTGATRGIGKAIADDLYSLGADLILTGTHQDQIDELNLKGGDRKKYYCVDFSNHDAVKDFTETLSAHNNIDICINNAGINRIDLLEQTKEEDFDDIMAVNLKGPYMVTRAVCPGMKARGYGRIVNISSIWGVISKKGRSIYSASKFGLIGLTKTISNEMASSGVLVNAVSPGFVLTDLTKSTLSKKEIDELAKQVPAGRLADPGEIARVVVFLVSGLNTYLTGKNIVVDGGFIDV